MSGRVISRIGVVTALAVAVAVSGCAGGREHGVAGAEKTLVHRCAAGAVRPVGSADIAWAAVVERPLTAFRAPGRAPIAHFGLLNVNGVPNVLGILGKRVDTSCRATWLHVALPMRPNGVTGWVRARNVQRASVRTRITVDLSERRVRLYRRGKLVLTSRAAVGSSATPTPLGRYYVNQRLVPRDASGPFGPGAVGISAFSPVLTGWAQGGPIAIHGTNEPWSIGRAVSNGCIRLPNTVLRRLFKQALAGTPVLIRR
jgi:lipoprotein-anchoring transpeptidase ErfK/SrfK